MQKFSVIIPLLNKGSYIERALKSVLFQTTNNFEIIIIDGGSTDGGPEIVNNFKDPRIKIIFQYKERPGVSAARNIGVDEAQYDFIAFLDADDEWLPKHLEIIRNLIQKYPDAGMYVTAYKIQEVDRKIAQWPNYACIPNAPWDGLLPNYFKSIALGSWPVITSVVVIPRKIFYEAGGFPEGYWYGEDMDLWGKIALKYPVAFSWELGALYHREASNRLCSKKLPEDYVEPFIKTIYASLEKGELPVDFVEPLHEYLWKMEIIRAKNYVWKAKGDIARKILKKCDTKWHRSEKMKWMLLSYIPHSIFILIYHIKQSYYNFKTIASKIVSPK